MGYTYIAWKHGSCQFFRKLHNATHLKTLGGGAPGPIPARGWYFSYELQISHHPGRHISSIWTNQCLRNGNAEAELSRLGGALFVCQEFFRENWMEWYLTPQKICPSHLRRWKVVGFALRDFVLVSMSYVSCNLAACCSNSIELWYWITRYDLSTQGFPFKAHLMR